MNEIVWLAHGGPGSGWFRNKGHVPGSQGGKVTNYFARKRKTKAAKKELDDYVDSDYFTKGDRAGYGTKDVKSIVVKSNDNDVKQLELREIVPTDDFCLYMKLAETKEEALKWFLERKQRELYEVQKTYNSLFVQYSWAVEELLKIKEDKND